jgi:hypothetical protein
MELAEHVVGPWGQMTAQRLPSECLPRFQIDADLGPSYREVMQVETFVSDYESTTRSYGGVVDRMDIVKVVIDCNDDVWPVFRLGVEDDRGSGSGNIARGAW